MIYGSSPLLKNLVLQMFGLRGLQYGGAFWFAELAVAQCGLELLGLEEKKKIEKKKKIYK
jgi:hypothetical protein